MKVTPSRHCPYIRTCWAQIWDQTPQKPASWKKACSFLNLFLVILVYLVASGGDFKLCGSFSESTSSSGSTPRNFFSSKHKHNSTHRYTYLHNCVLKMDYYRFDSTCIYVRIYILYLSVTFETNGDKRANRREYSSFFSCMLISPILKILMAFSGDKSGSWAVTVRFW